MDTPIPPATLEQNLTLRDYAAILNKRRLTVFSVFLVVFVVSIILGLKKETPLYTSSSTILLERNLGAANSALGGYYYWDPEFLPTQTEIIKSKKVALRVVDNLQLDTRYHPHFLSADVRPPSMLLSLRNALVSMLHNLFGSKDQGTADGGKGQKGHPADDKNIIAEIIRSRIDVRPIKETRVVDILYTDINPQVAKLVTDALIQAYIEETVDIKLSSTQQSLKWMTSKAVLERQKLEDSERKLQDYMREHNLVTLENRLAVYPEKLSQFSTELSSAEAKRKELEDLRDQIARFQNDQHILETIPQFAQNPNLQSLRDQILKAEQRIKELSQKYGPKHPAMIKALEDRDVLNREKDHEIRRITESLHKSLDLAKSQENNLHELLAATKAEYLDVNERFMQYSIMKREVDSSRALYEALTSSLKKASVTEESQNVNIWVMREASLPDAPSNQKPRRTVLIGFVLAMAAGIGLALLVEYLDNTIKSSDDIEKRYGLTVLGAILETKKNEQIENIILEQAQSPVAENYKMIRSSLLLSSADQPPQTILVTSMKAQEGKTSTCLNLARSLSQIAGKILVIDADMRKPRLHKLLKVANDKGLSSYLSGNVAADLALVTPEDKIHLIPSGPVPPNPVELVSSQRLKTLLKELGSTYDFIIIDSPPIINLADGLILSTLVDGTLLVTRVGKTTFDVFATGLKKLNDFKPHILGVVLNAMSSRSGLHTYYQYYTYYQDDTSGREKK